MSLSRRRSPGRGRLAKIIRKIAAHLGILTRREAPVRDDLSMTTTMGNGANAGLRGQFWLAGAQKDGNTVPGRLFLEAGTHPTLELDGILTPLDRETDRRELPDGTVARVRTPVASEELVRQSLTVHGRLDETGEAVTLPAAFTVGGQWAVLGAAKGSQRLQSFYALLGAHVDGANAQFTQVRIRLRHLDAWAALPGFSLASDPTSGKLTLTFEKPTSPSAPLSSGARVTLEQITQVSQSTVCGGQLERQVWINVLDLPPTTYREIERQVVKPLMNLLTLAVDAECPLVTVMVSTGPDAPWLTVHHAAAKNPAEEIIPIRRILLPLAEIGMEGVAAWLDSIVRLGPLPSVVARLVSSQDDTLEGQLLELTTVAEGLHRLLRPEIKRMTKSQAKEARSKALEGVKELPEGVQVAVESALHHLTDMSYPRRMLDLAGHLKHAVPGVTGNTAEWKKRVVDARNGFAHQLEDGFLDEAAAEQSIAIFLSLRWLLTGMLLLLTGIEPTKLGSRISDHESYQLFLSQARAWLPTVYGNSQDAAG